MAEPLVLLPGLMSDARVFWPQIAALSSTLSVTVAPVTLGERVEEIASGLLDQLPKRFALAGLGLGGIIALEVMRRAPDRVTRVALIDTNPIAETPQVAAARELLIVKAKSGRMADVMNHEIQPGFLAPGPNRNAIIDIAMDMAETLGPEVYVRQARTLQRGRDQQAVLRKCKVPALVMCGDVEKLNRIKRHSFMAELIPNATLSVIAGAGLLPTLEQPQASTVALRSWMKIPSALR
ncbi:MAG: alpha/beta fold hydrolase [Sulfitobacter sp.]|uniref:alpha/beta fold hydrolase n=1 Tax=Sulfitobacter sp. TaxID=1903071 RepID=UPI0040593507